MLDGMHCSVDQLDPCMRTNKIRLGRKLPLTDINPDSWEVITADCSGWHFAVCDRGASSWRTGESKGKNDSRTRLPTCRQTLCVTTVANIFFLLLLFAKSHYLHYLQYGLNISLDNTVFYLQYNAYWLLMLLNKTGLYLQFNTYCLKHKHNI